MTGASPCSFKTWVAPKSLTFLSDPSLCHAEYQDRSLVQTVLTMAKMEHDDSALTKEENGLPVLNSSEVHAELQD
eukprot:CAMPEP_0206504468 /NCGR_PEP_ID=MMETSP0324_2-20121206/55511_1 /ASSEMBLY_ACC=CAM_ASM_000836 /TAXON_ID=2866 /ORGANISM="Crypthecodinium cohnii, Strain Seligo" /LENGTH=74 /DNA_ID=CAMNT_0053993659 /DNA_START=145 /DNA_END=370 /DNA_ORIENTATION=+